MKKLLIILFLSILFIGYLYLSFNSTSFTPPGSFGVPIHPVDPLNQQNRLDHFIDSLDHEFQGKRLTLDAKIGRIYTRSEKNMEDGIVYGDSLIRYDSSLNHLNIEDIHLLLGEILYDHDSINRALKRFEKSSISSRTNANIVACYLYLGDTVKARNMLKKFARSNTEMLWYLGNFYEIMGKRDSALYYYQTLYEKDSVMYWYSLRRIIRVKNPKSHLYKELEILNKGQRPKEKDILLFNN